jgi:ADP-dependent NAD(P)H-hydrate dehydratase / NAD(P)H-hydrate epimerase
MEILTAASMRRVDDRTIRELRIPGLSLMESAGRGVSAALLEEIPRLASRRVVVFCGKGNNGGDGLVAARHLNRRGVTPLVLLAARGDEFRGDAAVNLTRAREDGITIVELADDADGSRRVPDIDGDTVVVDALLGTGATGGARGVVARAIDAINAFPATIVAIDLPSGADTDSGRLLGPTVRAHRTLTLCRPKPCLVLEPAASHAGPWRVLDIGIPDEAVAAERSSLEWLDADSAARLFPVRPQDAHKGTMGHLLAVAGSRGKPGAAAILARAALRSGVGLVTVAAPRSVQPVVAAAQLEAMTEPLAETRAGALDRAAAVVALRLLGARDALAMGPGLGTAVGTRAAVVAILAGRSAPAVLDADGLNAFATDKGARARLRAGDHPLVLTPHPGEAARLLRTTPREIQNDRLGSARRLAAETGSIVVLKGRRTVVSHADGRASFNSTGNAGMATGGTGDALTGILGALLARGMSGFDAARLGTYVHGAAGDLAAARIGEDGLIAGDLIEALPRAWSELAERRRGVNRWTPGV